MGKFQYNDANVWVGSCDKELSFFPSLENVWLEDLPKLKGWKRGVVGQVEDNNKGNNLQSQQLLRPCCFSKLQTLTIIDCPELTSLPSCPSLEKLNLEKFNEGLQIMNKKRDEVAPASSSASTSCYEIVNSKLQSFKIDNMAWPNSLPSEYFHCVNTLTLWNVNEEMDVDLPDWMQFLPALQTLKFKYCRELKVIPKWMPKLTLHCTLFRKPDEKMQKGSTWR
uniref:Disease resistance protein n=1 Tax=Chenopodium quinoa TaxID=63459 RepID=A0A803MTU4_CHEQI